MFINNFDTLRGRRSHAWFEIWFSSTVSGTLNKPSSITLSSSAVIRTITGAPSCPKQSDSGSVQPCLTDTFPLFFHPPAAIPITHATLCGYVPRFYPSINLTTTSVLLVTPPQPREMACEEEVQNFTILYKKLPGWWQKWLLVSLFCWAINYLRNETNSMYQWQIAHII